MLVQCSDGTMGNPQAMTLKNLAVFLKAGSTDSLIPESYIVSTQYNLVNLTSFDFMTTQIVTFAFTSNQTFFSSNVPYTYTTFVNPFKGPFYQNGVMYDGQMYGKEWRLLKDRIITGWTRPTGSNIITTTMTDGPECGQNLVDYNNENPSRACLGSGNSVTHYWKIVSRG